MKADLSVIVPAYNCGKYLENCIESIRINETVNIECIVVNDGSTDNTKFIIESLKVNYPNIIVIDKKNGGVSSARNAGLRIASGTFVTFVDGDDFLEYVDFSFLKKFKEKDLFCLDMYFFKDGGYSRVPFENTNLATNLMDYPIFMNSVCNKIFRNDIIKKYDLIFDEEQWATEDLLFVINYIVKINEQQIRYINDRYYVYRDNSSSATKKGLSLDTVENNILAYKKIVSVLNEKREKNFNRYSKYLRVRMNFPFLTNNKIFNPSKYRENTKSLDFWIYDKRADKFIVSVLARIHADFMLKWIIKLRNM